MRRSWSRGRYTSHSNLTLVDGDQIAVVGGGPAGSFFALHLLEAAHKAGRQLKVTIFEPKSFSAQGPAGCNKSAGILSPPLLTNMAESGLSIPPVVQMGKIGCFRIHLNGQNSREAPARQSRDNDQVNAAVFAPDSDPLPITVYRGGGPKRAVMEADVSFDGWLLEQAAARGATVVQQFILEIDFTSECPRLQTPTGTQAFDLIVLATGVNGHLPSLLGLAYQPPRTEKMAQGEVPWHDPASAERTAATAHVYLNGLPGLVFGALVPKGRYVSVSILGQQLPSGAMRRFLASPGVEAVLAAGSPRTKGSGEPPKPLPRLCGCRPQIAVGPAQQFYADRFVAVGDAAVSRLYKDGIGSAFQTSQAAARSAVFHGVGARDFAAGYAPTCQAIQRDNGYGRLLFGFWGWSHRSPRLGQALLQTLQQEAELPPAQCRWRPALWSVLTGSASYQAIWRQVMRPQAMTRFVRALSSPRHGSQDRAVIRSY